MYRDIDDRTMADTEDDRTLSELVVTELVEQGLDSSMRETILDAVEESEGTAAGDGSRSLPLAGALFGLGAAIGFLAGRESGELEDVSLDEIEEPEIIESVTDADEDEDEEAAAAEEAEAETEDAEEETEDAESSGVLGRLVLALGAIAVIVFARRLLADDDTEEWEPIEEFEPATDLEDEDEFGADEDEDEFGVDDDENVEADEVEE
jgi:hypothetical protein